MNIPQQYRLPLAAAVLFCIFFYVQILPNLGYVSTPVDPTDRELVCYMNRYPELKAEFQGDIARARQHWYKVGALEGRVPHCPRLFDPSRNAAPPLTDREARQYLQTYTDLIRLYGKDNVAAARTHWQQYGFAEGRVASQAWTSDLPSQLFLLSGPGQGCQPDAYGRLRCQGAMKAFAVKHLGDDVISLSSDNKVCGDTPDGQGVTCTSSTTGPAEMFTYQKMGQNKLTLKSGLTQRYCRNDQGQVVCDSEDPAAFQFYMRSLPKPDNTNVRTKPWPPATTWVAPPPPVPVAPAVPVGPTTTTTTATTTSTSVQPTPMTTSTARSRILVEPTTSTRSIDGAWWSFFFGGR